MNAEATTVESVQTPARIPMAERPPAHNRLRGTSPALAAGRLDKPVCEPTTKKRRECAGKENHRRQSSRKIL